MKTDMKIILQAITNTLPFLKSKHTAPYATKLNPFNKQGALLFQKTKHMVTPLSLS